MLLMGDEVRRTQGGNNNAYCQDNEISWFDWRDIDRHGDVHRFVQQLIHHRRRCHPADDRSTLREVLARAGVQWHGARLGAPDWSPDSRSLAYTMTCAPDGRLMHVMLNAWWEALEFEVPLRPIGPETAWRLCIDTARPTPNDIRPWEEATPYAAPAYLVQPRSVVVLFARAPHEP
jgi:isoamylase